VDPWITDWERSPRYPVYTQANAVIVSREPGIPCVVGVHDATRTIPDGAVVTVIELPED
jgi:phosphoenolpyruvate synthase/pyruvate phosphate dikinase